MKFKGSLEKLDEFEREWSHFKTGGNTSSANTSLTAPATNT